MSLFVVNMKKLLVSLSGKKLLVSLSGKKLLVAQFAGAGGASAGVGVSSGAT